MKCPKFLPLVSSLPKFVDESDQGADRVLPTAEICSCGICISDLMGSGSEFQFLIQSDFLTPVKLAVMIQWGLREA